MSIKHPLDDIWPVLDPPADFWQRVLAALETPGAVEAPAPVAPSLPPPRPRARSGRALWAIGGLVGGALATAGILVAIRAPVERKADEAVLSGHLVVDIRQTVAIGERGLAVAERGAELGWFVVAGHPRVDQPRGSVFYRVDRGGPFTVATPVGDIRVTGTCFRVAVRPDPEVSQSTVALVEVLEGSVLLVGGRGQLALTAGETGRMSLEAAPLRLDPERETRASTPDPRPEMEARLRRLEQALADARKATAGDRPRSNKFELTPDDLRAMARRCEFRYYLPRHLTAIDAPSVSESLASGLDSEERTGLLRLMQEQRTHYVEALQSLYAEVTGDRSIAVRLAPKSLQEELYAKLDPEDIKDARRRILEEWEQGAPIAHRGPRPPAERFLRLVSGSDDQFFRKLVDLVGLERARQIREKTTSDSISVSPAFDCKPKDR